ncbi:MAG: tetratricopeptide repeat protein [Caldilineaceae bacterium]|nr:tetratricopeptide repeat protein [Caldilineaceae bacterium]MXZ22211.1 tetratricopeptide repeat protein [Caldilineaceae bacterium SB0665_bin_25]
METRQHGSDAPLTLRALPTSFWYIVSASTGLAIIVVFVMAALGYRDGLRRGEAHTRQQVAILLQRASDMQDAGMTNEARTVYERIIEYDPQNEAAHSAILALEATATVETVPESISEPTAVDIEWARAVTLFEEGRWQQAIQRLSLVQTMQADYKIVERDQLLFISYVELARAAIAGGNLEEAVQLFDSALEVDPNNALVQQERYMTDHYVDVKTYWGADWARVIRLLEDLYRIDPKYRDVQYLLQRAHVQQGESFAREENWCAAAAEYTSAIAVLDWLELRGRRDELVSSCGNANRG